MGDLQELADWIDAVGYLLQPVVVTPDRKLVAGGRRCAAWPLAKTSDHGRLPIPVRVIDIDGIAAGKIAEYVENVGRKAFALSEQVALWLEIEPALREAARARQRHQAGDTGERGRLRDHMKAVTGTSGKTLEKAIAIYKAWQADVEKYDHLIVMMDERGADGAYKEFLRMQEPVSTEIPRARLVGRDQRMIDLLMKRLPAKLNDAIDSERHQMSISPGGLRAVCKCGATFDLPHRRGADIERSAKELAALIEAHWRAMVAEEGEAAS
jgi:hypothetical protein